MISDNAYSILAVLTNDIANIEISDRIKKLNIMNDYESYLFPVIYVDVYLTIEEYNYIKNKDDTKLRLSCKKFKLDNNGYLSSQYTDVFRNLEFAILNKDNLYIQTNNTNTNSQSQNMFDVRLIVMNVDDLNGNKKSIYGNFINTDLQRVIYYIINKLGQDKKTVVEQPDNIKVYDQIMLPYNTPYRQLVYLDTVYGLYQNGLKLFFDLDKNYIINKNETKVSYKETIIEIRNNIDLLLDTQETDSNRLIVPSNAMRYVSINKAREEFIGNNNAFILNDNNKSILTQNTDGNKTNVYYQKYNNPFVKNIVTSDINSLVQIYIENADYSLFNFVNVFYIEEEKNLFKNQRFNLAKYQHTFTFNKSRYFTLSTIMNLKKI